MHSCKNAPFKVQSDYYAHFVLHPVCICWANENSHDLAACVASVSMANFDVLAARKLGREQKKCSFLLSLQIFRGQKIEICHENACYAGYDLASSYWVSAPFLPLKERLKEGLLWGKHSKFTCVTFFNSTKNVLGKIVNLAVLLKGLPWLTKKGRFYVLTVFTDWSTILDLLYVKKQVEIRH